MAKTGTKWIVVGVLALAGLGVIGVVGLAALGGAASFALLRGSGGGGGGALDVPFRPELAFGEADVILARQGFPDTGQPCVVRGGEVRGADVAKSWEWSHAGQGLTDWTAAGDYAAGALIPPGGDPRTSAYVFHRHRGLVRELAGSDLAIAMMDHDELLVRDGGELSLHRLGTAGTAPAWTVSVPAGRYVAFFGWTDQSVLSFNDAVGISIFPRTGGGAPVVVDGVAALVGLARERREVLALRNGRVEVLGLDGTARTALDLGEGQPVSDTGDTPCLLGRHGSDWLVVYTTGVDNSIQDNGRGWMRRSDRMLAVVDAESGQVRARSPIGPWAVECQPPFTNLVQIDTDVGDVLVLVASHDREGGGAPQSLLESLDLATGTTAWRVEAGDVLRTPVVLRRYAQGVLLQLQDPTEQRPILARFERGRLTAAASFTGYVTVSPALTGDTSVWVSVAGSEATQWVRLDATTLRAVGGERPVVRDARAEVSRLLGLPTNAR